MAGALRLQKYDKQKRPRRASAERLQCHYRAASVVGRRSSLLRFGYSLREYLPGLVCLFNVRGMSFKKLYTNRHGHLIVALVWVLFAVLDATKTLAVMQLEGMEHNWLVVFAFETASWMPWLVATPVVLWLGRHGQLNEWRPRAWIIHAGAFACIDIAWAAWTTLLFQWSHPFSPSSSLAPLDNFLEGLYTNLPSTAIIYVSVLIVQSNLQYRARMAAQKSVVAELNGQLAVAQLNALRRQLEPHFLFNSLSAILGLVRSERFESAENMIADLSAFLRRTLASSGESEVSLREEVQFAQHYLAIQRARFADRLQVTVDIPQELQNARVPNLILQPLVENAVMHGIAKIKQGGRVEIAASAANGALLLNVSNDGPSLSGSSDPGRPGIGLSNVRARLAALYGGESSLIISDGKAGGVVVSMLVPLQ